MADPLQLIEDLLWILGAGLVSGLICKRIGVSLLVGYLLVGALIGELGIVSQDSHDLEYLARAGALLLLFSVGIEFSLEELMRLSRYFLIGGVVQMLLVTVPLAGVCLAAGLEWRVALLLGFAGALSSTVLVFKALAEWGQTGTPHGRRAVGILLFQDVALVPLMLLIPLLTESGASVPVVDVVWLAVKSLAFVVGVMAARWLIGKWVVSQLSNLRSVELVVLFSLCLLGGSCLLAFELGLPPAIGALAAGLMLSGNRLSRQVDSILLPFRESFAAVFFVTLGTLFNVRAFLEEPWLMAGALLGVLVLKSVAASLALRLIGLRWKAAVGMGVGLAQLGEFTFLVVAEGVSQGVLSPADYNRVLFVALGTLILTPELLKAGLRWTGGLPEDPIADPAGRRTGDPPIQTALVVGIGPVGRQVASRLETQGIEVCVVDLSPINVHPFAQQGFHAVSGDARSPSVLRSAQADRCRLAVVCVPQDEVAYQVVRAVRQLNAGASVVVRCRYQQNVGRLLAVGADEVVSEEAEAGGALLRRIETLKGTPGSGSPPPGGRRPSRERGSH